MLAMDITILGDVFDVAICVRCEKKDAVPAKFCGIALCIAGRWVGDVNPNLPIKSVLGELDHVLAKEERLNCSRMDAALTKLFPDELNQALALFYGDGMVSGGRYIFSLSEFGVGFDVSIDSESLVYSRIFGVTYDDDMRLFVMDNDNDDRNFIHETKNSDFFALLRGAQHYLNGKIVS